MTKRLILDLRKASLPKNWPLFTPLLVPIRKGRWFREYDVIEEEMPPGWKGKFVMHARRSYSNHSDKFKMVYPIGFDVRGFPKGTKIIEMEF